MIGTRRGRGFGLLNAQVQLPIQLLDCGLGFRSSRLLQFTQAIILIVVPRQIVG